MEGQSEGGIFKYFRTRLCNYYSITRTHTERRTHIPARNSDNAYFNILNSPLIPLALKNVRDYHFSKRSIYIGRGFRLEVLCGAYRCFCLLRAGNFSARFFPHDRVGFIRSVPPFPSGCSRCPAVGRAS